MKLNRIKLSGFIGIKKGLGLDEVEVDLTKANGLIALAGKNGNGKSTILENMSPYRCLASRDGALQHHVWSRDASKELDFTVGGELYRTVVKIDQKSGRQEGYVYINGNDHSEVNGKVAEFDKFIIDLFGSQNLFFNSVFCAQNSKKISDMTTGELKKLFVEFLRLDRLQRYEETSKQCIAVLYGKIAGVDKEIDRLQESADGIAVIQRMIKEKTELKTSLEELHSTHTTDLEKLGLKYKADERIVEQNRAAYTRIADIKTAIESIQEYIRYDETAKKKESESYAGKLHKVNNDLQLVEAILWDKEEVENAIARLKEIDLQSKILTDSKLALEKTTGITKEAISRKEKELYQVDTGKLLELQSQITNKQAELNHLSNERHILEKKILDLKVDKEWQFINRDLDYALGKASVLEKRDPDCKSETCSFIVDAIQAKAKIPDLERKLREHSKETDRVVKEAEEDFSRVTKCKKDVYQQLNELKNAVCIEEERVSQEKKKIAVDTNVLRGSLKQDVSTLNDLTIKINDLAKEAQSVSELSMKQKEIDMAATNKAILETRKEELLDESEEKKQAWDIRILAKEDQIDVERKKIIEIKSGIDDQAEYRMNNTAWEIQEKEKKIKQLDRDIVSLNSDINWLKDQEKSKTEAKKTLDLTMVKKTAIVNESSQWAYLRDACSKNGLQALEIDSVAPSIASYANSLLSTAFGPQTMVDFKTLDENGRETLDLMVVDEDGENVLLDNRSGGQKVWALKAMRLAMTMISKEKSGKDLKTFFCDEEDGPLDEKNAQNFIQLYRALMKRGDFEDCFYISHTPECIAMADYQLKFRKGGIDVV